MKKNMDSKKKDITYPSDFIPRLDIGWAATSRYLRIHAIHKWFSFRHSFSPELVDAVFADWNLKSGSVILDPFVGAGTTILSAKQHCFSAIGIDLSPLAVLSTKVKVQDYDIDSLLSPINQENLFTSLSVDDKYINEWSSSSPRLTKAFTREELIELLSIREKIFSLKEPIQSFYLLALLAILPKFSRAASDGGWFRWIDHEDQSPIIIKTYKDQIISMISDLQTQKDVQINNGFWKVILGDARSPDILEKDSIDGVITSPPYPNRHDYSRVFQMELLLLGKTEQEISELRHSSLRSHVEAFSPELRIKSAEKFNHPVLLDDVLEKMKDEVDKRIPRMVTGYFEDIFLTLVSLKHSLKKGAKLAFVVGNVRHCGVMIPVDEIILAIGSQLGFVQKQSWVVRLRGNSAQQMKKFGREPSRETIVMMQLPK
jgi:hypothetical protein